MLDKKLLTKKIGFEARKAYGLKLQNNIKEYGSLSFKETIIPKELKQEDFEKIAKNIENKSKDIENKRNLLKREFPKIEKEYTKFINERKTKIKELKNQNKKLIRERNDLISRYYKFQNELNNLYLQIENIKYQKKELQIEQTRISKDFQEEQSSITQKIENTKKSIKEYEQKKKELEEKRLALEGEKKYLNNCHELFNIANQEYSKYKQQLFVDELFRRQFEEQCKENKNLMESEAYKIAQNNFDVNIKKHKLYSNAAKSNIDEYKQIISENSFVYMYIDEIKKKIKEIDPLIYINKQYLSTLEKEQTGSLSKISLEYGKKTKECDNKIKKLDKELNEKYLILESLVKKYNNIQFLDNKRYRCLQKQIAKNQNQIDKLNQGIDIEKQQYDKKKKAYNRALGLYNKQNKQINNNNNVIAKNNVLQKKYKKLI